MTFEITSCLKILDRLVSFDTTSHKSNSDLIYWVKDYLNSLGVACTLLPNPTGEKFNLIATIGDPSVPGIVLSGHTDVVPAESSNWRSDPFTLRQDEGRVYGRGTTDMKGFLSIVLAAVPAILEQPLAMPITLAFSYDEEVGCFGAQSLAGAIPTGQHVIVGEPTTLHRGTRHKGARVQKLSITGVPAHSGTPSLGLSAIEYSQAILSQLIKLGHDLSDSRSSFPSTLVVTGINGGGAVNIVPANCEVTWLFRPANAADARKVGQKISEMNQLLHRQLNEMAPEAGSSLITVCDVPLFQSDAPLLMSGRIGKVFEARPAVDLSFATEAGIYQSAGHSVVVCGPGDMAQGHINNEYIQSSALQDGIKFINEVVNAARS
jgi:acetylornithine deacetylase